MHALIGHVAQPFTHLDVRSLGVEHQAGLLELARQRHIEVTAQIAVESLDLALGLRTVRLAQPGQEAVPLGQVEQPGVPAVVTIAIRIAFDNDGLGVVVKDLARNAAQGFKQRVMTGDQRLGAFIGGEACPAPTTEAERGGEGVKRVGAAAEDNEIALHLPTGLGLEPHDRVRLRHGLMRVHESLQASQLAIVAACTQLAHQRRRGDDLGCCGAHAFEDVRLERSELGWSRFTRLVARHFLGRQVPRHRVARNAQAPRDLALRYALGFEHMDLHPLFLLEHRQPLRAKD
ncbi:hypothetical protein WG70_22010 [Burkholderia oklahomensis EO147]|nr:hypothetical protein WG70_22010 [Burkholderia oklahomensis EO147]